MKRLLFPFIAFTFILLKSAPSIACDNPKDAKTLLLEYPVVVAGQFQTTDHFEIKKVYKGFRSRPINVSLSGIDKSQIKIGQPAIILSDFEKDHAVLKDCGMIFYKDTNSNGVSYSSLLAEAAVYNAIVKTKLETVIGFNDWGKYEEISKFLRDNSDYLALLEFSRNNIDFVTKNVHTNYTNNGWDLEECARSVHPDTLYLTSELINGLATATRTGLIMGSSLYRDTVNDLGKSLIEIKQYDDAIFDLCATDTDSLWLQAVLTARRPELLGNKKLDRIYSLSNLDLSGLKLGGIVAGGIWQSVRVNGTDFTGANFVDAKFENVDLDDAILDLVTYSCKTQFPTGFDPIAHHMIPAWKYHGCDNVPQPKINLSKMRLKPSDPSNQSSYGGNPVLRFINFENVDARSSFLGTIYCDCKFNNANFDGTEINLRFVEHAGTVSNSSFRNAKLSGSSFRVTLINDDFTGADLSDVNFGGATYDAATKWPKGFNPEAAGMVKSSQ